MGRQGKTGQTIWRLAGDSSPVLLALDTNFMSSGINSFDDRMVQVDADVSCMLKLFGVLAARQQQLFNSAKVWWSNVNMFEFQEFCFWLLS